MAVTVATATSNGSESLPAHEERLKIVNQDNLLLTRHIAKECPELAKRHRRGVNDEDTFAAKLQVATTLHSQLLTQLIECLRAKALAGAAGPSTKIATTTMKSTTPVRAECLTAVNYTESWRMDHIGKGYKPGGTYSLNGYACDFDRTDVHWFRFSAAAGNRMLNFCPLQYSCGTGVPGQMSPCLVPLESPEQSRHMEQSKVIVNIVEAV